MNQTARQRGLAPLYEPRREMYAAGWLRILTPSAQLLLTALYAAADPHNREVALDYAAMERAGLSRASIASALMELITFTFVQDTGRRRRRHRVLFLTGAVPALSRMEQQALNNQWVRRLVIARVMGETLSDADQAQIERRLRRLSRSPNQLRQIERYFLESIYALPPGPAESFRAVLAAIIPRRGDSMRDVVLTFPASSGVPSGGTDRQRTAPPPAARSQAEPPAAPVPAAPAVQTSQTLSGTASPAPDRQPLPEDAIEQLPVRLQTVVRTYNFHSPVPFSAADLPALWEAYRQYTPAHITRAIIDVMSVPDEPDLSRCKTDAQREAARERHERKRRIRDRFTGEFAYFVPLLRMYGQSRRPRAGAAAPAKEERNRDKHPSIQRSFPDRAAIIANLRRASQQNGDDR